MMDVQDRYVIVEAHALGAVLDLSERACEAIDRVSSNDPITRELRGALAQVRASALADPS